MAKQTGIFPLEGTIGNVTFVKTRFGHLARQKGGVSASRIQNDPRFARTRENGQEFGRACKNGKLLRQSMATLIRNVSDPRMNSRLVHQVMQAIHADPLSARGLRNLAGSQSALLAGFEFNANAKLSATVLAPFSGTINRSTGALEVSVPSFIPRNQVVAPSGATHYKLVAAGAALDFLNNSQEHDEDATAELPWDGTATQAVSLNCSLSAASTHPIFLAFGIQFYQQLNGTTYVLNHGAFNALQIIQVDA